MDALHKLEVCSDVMVSNTKSNIYLAGVPRLARDMILRDLGFGMGKFPARYLGGLEFHLHSEKSPLRNCHHFLKQLRLTFISGMIRIFHMPGRWNSFAQFAKAWRLFGYMCATFLWGGRQSRVAWKEIGCPKEEGGLGLMDLKIWNMALWNIHADANTLWLKWVHSVYLRGQSIWDYNNRNRDSYLMKRLCDIKDAIIVAFGNRQRAIDGLAKLVMGKKFLSGKLKKEYGGCRVHARTARLGLATSVYQVWIACNALRFDGKKPSPEAIVAKVKVSTYRILYQIYPENTPIILGPQRV
ncbi:hypothetical protein LIER_36756 [Lithospermum erythrorhizon]|uniref:Reverse transcriptase n=1 Tax=Lithospermum erythrorhizon TaxID=34254 RepID=A0AAV3PA91_LITER